MLFRSNVKWNWMNLKVVSFYSRLGAGASFSRSEVGGESGKSTQFAFQVSPVGVEVGGRVAAYAEAGIGTSGCLLSASATASDTLSGYGKGAHSSQDAPLFVGGSPRRGVLTPSQALFRPSRSASCRRR